jgi:hypothetical protein
MPFVLDPPYPVAVLRKYRELADTLFPFIETETEDDSRVGAEDLQEMWIFEFGPHVVCKVARYLVPADALHPKSVTVIDECPMTDCNGSLDAAGVCGTCGHHVIVGSSDDEYAETFVN